METNKLNVLNDNLAQMWLSYQDKNPRIKIQEAAASLGVTEAELIAVRCDDSNIRLRNDFANIFRELSQFGELLAVTRNDSVVHETRGRYLDMRLHGNVGMFFHPGLDTRFFFDCWQSVFAVNEFNRFSIQFFDRYGYVAHKVFMTDKTDLLKYNQLIHKFKDPQQAKFEAVEALPIKKQNQALDAEKLHSRWSSMKDVHEASRIVKSLAGGDHQQVYRALGEQYACPLEVAFVEKFLETMSLTQQSLMIFVMGRAAVQSYGGKINRITRSEPWFNILDTNFNLHLKSDGIASVWLVRKPTDDGWITSVDIFDHEGNQLMIICDHRMKGWPESESWTKTLLDTAGRFHQA